MARNKSPAGLNSLRMLRQRGIAHEVLAYPESLKSAESVAQYLALPPGAIYKTLVASDANGKSPYLALIASDRELDLRLMARAAAVKRVRMLPQRDAERMTSMKAGGIGALALLNKRWPIFLDSGAAEQEWLVMNAGRRGVQVRLRREDFIALTGATMADIARKP